MRLWVCTPNAESSLDCYVIFVPGRNMGKAAFFSTIWGVQAAGFSGWVHGPSLFSCPHFSNCKMNMRTFQHLPEKYILKMNIVMHQLMIHTLGIDSEKCVSRQFCGCVNNTECTQIQMVQPTTLLGYMVDHHHICGPSLIVDQTVIKCMTVHKCLVSFRQEGYKYKYPITPRVATIRHIYFLIALTAQ